MFDVSITYRNIFLKLIIGLRNDYKKRKKVELTDYRQTTKNLPKVVVVF